MLPSAQGSVPWVTHMVLSSVMCSIHSLTGSQIVHTRTHQPFGHTTLKQSTCGASFSKLLIASAYPAFKLITFIAHVPPWAIPPGPGCMGATRQRTHQYIRAPRHRTVPSRKARPPWAGLSRHRRQRRRRQSHCPGACATWRTCHNCRTLSCPWQHSYAGTYGHDSCIQNGLLLPMLPPTSQEVTDACHAAGLPASLEVLQLDLGNLDNVQRVAHQLGRRFKPRTMPRMHIQSLAAAVV